MAAAAKRTLKKPAKARKAVARTPQGETGIGETQLPEISSIGLAGKFAEDMTHIPSSLSTLILSTGYNEADERFVLLPFMEMSIQGIRQGDVKDGKEPEDFETIFSRTIPLENATWLAFDLLRDIASATARLEEMVEGNLRLDHPRLAHAKLFAELAEKEAARCAETLSKLLPREDHDAAGSPGQD